MKNETQSRSRSLSLGYDLQTMSVEQELAADHFHSNLTVEAERFSESVGEKLPFREWHSWCNPNGCYQMDCNMKCRWPLTTLGYPVYINEVPRTSQFVLFEWLRHSYPTVSIKTYCAQYLVSFQLIRRYL